MMVGTADHTEVMSPFEPSLHCLGTFERSHGMEVGKGGVPALRTAVKADDLHYGREFFIEGIPVDSPIAFRIPDVVGEHDLILIGRSF